MNTEQTVGEYIAVLLKENSELKLDALRYRFLRNVADPGDWSYISYQEADVMDKVIDSEI